MLSLKFKDFHFLSSTRGSATVSIIVLIVIIGSVMLAGGIFPRTPGSGDGNQGQRTQGVPDEASLTPGVERENLQLQTIRFRECAETITMDLLLDRTGSMTDRTPSGVTKIDRLKEAVLALTNNLSDNSIIGIQSFSSRGMSNDIPVSFYRDVRNQVPSAVNALSANGQTPTHDALSFSYQVLQSSIPQFPGRTFNFILISDGQPQPPEQDPRLFSPNPADQIKSLGVNVYTLAIYDQQQAGNPALADLLRSIASSPDNYFQANTADDTASLLTAITEKICESQPTPATGQ